MHTLKIGTTRFHFNSDFSGDVEMIDERPSVTDEATNEIALPAADLLGFAAHAIMQITIASVENEPASTALFWRAKSSRWPAVSEPTAD